MKDKISGKKFGAILVVLILVLFGVLGYFIYHSNSYNKSATNITSNIASNSTLDKITIDKKAIEVGKRLSNGQCEGEGVPYKLSVSPMKPEDFPYIIPYGLTVGGHVTPIDHQYFPPIIFHSPRDTYEVRAMADSTIVNIQPRVKSEGTEYRLHFAVTCTFFYYYDLVTSLSPDIKKIYDDANGQYKRPVKISIKAGQVIGRIGGQTLDYAVWDTTKQLKGFIVPEHYYDAEPWKIYTADPLNYYTDDLKALILSKYVRTAEPISGKIDNDIDGKLIGNWFQEGTDGYGGASKTTATKDYWTGHLAIAPDLYDPSAFIISVGFLASSADNPRNQFSVKRSSLNPSSVGVETGLVKYELRDWTYLKQDGSPWNNAEFSRGIKLNNENTEIKGCAITQLLETRKLKFEIFLDKRCENINDFSSSARIYER